MHEYYFKIRKGDVEFEFSTSDKFTFEEKLSDWINGINNGITVVPPAPPVLPTKESREKQEDKPQRKGFIDVKNLTSIKDIQAPNLDFDVKDKTFALSGDDFEKSLEEAVANPKIEVVEKVDTLSDFETYLNSYNHRNQTDNLIITAMYVLNIENQERFTLKQLNAKLVPLGLLPIDHSMIESSIEEKLIRIVPDLTGTSEVTEYTLTEDGEGYFVE